MKEEQRIKKEIKDLEEMFDKKRSKPIALFRITRKAKRLTTRLDHLKKAKYADTDPRPQRLKRVGSKWSTYHPSMGRAKEKIVARRRRNNKIAAKSRKVNQRRAA